MYLDFNKDKRRGRKKKNEEFSFYKERKNGEFWKILLVFVLAIALGYGGYAISKVNLTQEREQEQESLPLLEENMAQITVKELYYGDKYAVMSEVFKTMYLVSPNKAGVDEQAALELEIVRQTLIAVEKMKKNGDCIAEGELGNVVTVSV